jgi:hypothetical protein
MAIAWACLATFWTVIAASIVAATIIAPGAFWWRPSLSHFGAVGARSQVVYDCMQLVAAGALFGLAVALPVACAPLEAAEKITHAQRLGIGAVIGTVALPLGVLAALPYNVGGRLGWQIYVAHNVAGWAEALLPAAAMLLLPWALPVFPRRFYRLTWGFLAFLAAVWFLFVVTRVLAHGLSELIAYGTLGIWSFALVAELQRAVASTEAATIGSLPGTGRGQHGQNGVAT